MATIYRFPICVWNSGKDAVTVRLVDDGYDDISITAESKKDAIAQIKEYLQYLAKVDSWKLFEPDFFDPEMRVLKFSVIPEYHVGRRKYPCREAFPFRMPCVIGKRKAGSPIGYIPTLNQFFDYHREDSFEKLAVHIAQRNLSGKTPAVLAQSLAPSEVEIEQISVTLKDAPNRSHWERELQPLSVVADHLGSQRFKKQARTWEREKELEAIARLLGEESNSLCLVGPSGCGKTSLLIEAARKIERENSSKENEKRRFWMTNGSRLIAGMRWLGQWEERLEEVIRQLAGIDGVLCAESLSDLTRLGGENAEDSLAAFLLPYLQHGELRLVVEATPEEFAACERALPGLVDQLQVIKLEAFTNDQARTILERAAETHTRNDNVNFTPAAASRVHSLFKRFQPYVAFPGKVLGFASALVDETLNRAEHDPVIGVRDVEDHFAEYSGLPQSLTHSDAAFDHEGLVNYLSSQVLSQEEAVNTTSRVVAKFAAGLNDPGRPISVMLFCGPTGVGKTQMIRSLGEYLFPNRPEGERVIRLDMSEYAGGDASIRLLGHPYGEPSDLIKQVRANPFSILLLDEVEKADDEVFDIFLNVFEEGRLTDPLGRITSFQSCLIVMTSNLGAGASGSIGFANSDNWETRSSEIDRSAVLNFFRPEFFNRLDQVVYFQPLDRKTIEQITIKELEAINQREGLEERGLELYVEPYLVEDLAKRGFDPVYGARPLQRSIEEILTLPFARWLSENKVKSGDRIVAVKVGDEVEFQVEE